MQLGPFIIRSHPGATNLKVHYDEYASPRDFRNQLSDRDRRAVSLKHKSLKHKFRERYAR